jgi:3',5'-cyclic AMP phosphodiesterase CpdA
MRTSGSKAALETDIFASVLIDSEVRTTILTNFGIGTLVPRTEVRTSLRLACMRTSGSKAALETDIFASVAGMFVLAHISDLHLALTPKVLELPSKRGLCFINWQRKRKYIHRPDVLNAITRDLRARPADHIAVTGDLVNFSLAGEYAWARHWLESIGPPNDVTVVPGNHDVYVRGVEEFPAKFWGDYMRGDDGLDQFPFLRRRGQIALIALASGVPTGPFMATGRLGQTQLARLAEALEQTRGSFRIVLIHHPPVSPRRRYFRRLVDAGELRVVLAAKGAELLLHGHDHRRSLLWLEGPGGKKIPALGVPSASACTQHGEEHPAGYQVLQIERSGNAWRCETAAYERAADNTVRECARYRIC